MIEGYILGSRFTMGAVSGVANSIFFHHEHTGVPDNYARGAIYTVSGDRPSVLINETGLHAISTTDGWVQLDFLERPTLDAGTEYFLLVWIGSSLTGTSTLSYDAPGGNQGFTKGVGYGPVGNFPATMTGGTVRTFRFSLYATYDQILGTVTNDLKAVFHVGQDSKDLKAEFRLTQEDLFAEFTLRQGIYDLFSKAVIRNTGSQDLGGFFNLAQFASTDLWAKFIVRKITTKNLFSEFVVFRPFSDLKATLSVRAVATKDIYAETVIRHSATEDLAAEFIVRHDGVEKDLKAVTVVRHTDTNELYAVFRVGGSADLKATLYITTNPNQPAYSFVIDDNISAWLNFLSLNGKGFIGEPTFLDDDTVVYSGVNSLKITAERVEKGYKEFTFGLVYEPTDLGTRIVRRRDTYKDLKATFSVGEEMRDFYVSPFIAPYVSPEYITDDHYKFAGRVSIYDGAAVGLTSWKQWLTGVFQADITFTPSSSDEISMAFGWSVSGIPAIHGGYAILRYTPGGQWDFVTSNDGNTTEETDVSSHMSTSQHTIKVERTGSSYILTIDGTVRATHSTNIPPTTDKLPVVISIFQITATSPDEAFSLDIDNISLPT